MAPEGKPVVIAREACIWRSHKHRCATSAIWTGAVFVCYDAVSRDVLFAADVAYVSRDGSA